MRASFEIAHIYETIENPKFNSWIKSFGIGQLPETYKAGSVGYAFFVDDFVLKFTPDRKEATAAAILKNYESQHLAKIYDVRFLKNFCDTRCLYVVLLERLDTNVAKKHRLAGNYVYDFLDFNPGYLKDVDLAYNSISKCIEDNEIKNIVRKILQSLFEIQSETGILLQDTHGSNLALKNREMAFFDFGRCLIDFNHKKADEVCIKKLP